jgi:hypothetical protein
MTTIIEDDIQKVINQIDPDKLKCSICDRWLTREQIKQQYPTTKTILTDKDFKKDFSIASNKGFICYKCFKKSWEKRRVKKRI